MHTSVGRWQMTGAADHVRRGRRRSGTAFNRAPPPESSDEDEDEDDEGGGEHQVRFQADPASQSPSRMPRRARSGAHCLSKGELKDNVKGTYRYGERLQ